MENGNGEVALTEVLETAEAPDMGRQLQTAIGAYFGVEPDAVVGFAVACERIDPQQGLTLSSVWSADTPVWRLESFARELLRTLDRSLRGEHALATAPVDGPTSRRDRRRRARGRRG